MEDTFAKHLTCQLPHSKAQDVIPDIFMEGTMVSRINAKQLIPENIFLFGNPLDENTPVRTLEINPFDVCNHRCTWCFTRPYRGVESSNAFELRSRIDEFIRMGGLAIHFSGGGEPLLFKPFTESSSYFENKTILEYLSLTGIWAGLITNGFLLDRLPKLSKIPLLAFIRVSLDAVNNKTHAIRHGCKTSQFDSITKALKERIEERGGSSTPAIGASFIVEPTSGQFTNAEELESLINYAKEINLDFVQIKHVHTNRVEEADNRMKMVFDLLTTLTSGNIQVWVHRYRPANPVGLCRITRLIEVWNAEFDSYPCCHLSGQKEYQRVKSSNPTLRELKSCKSNVCRYDSMNRLLEKVISEKQVILSTSTNRLKENLTNYGFHPYRLFPSSPDLFSINL